MSNNFINSLMEEYNQRNQDKVTLSIRLSIKEDLILQELADALETTRQDIITNLINRYIVEAWKEKTLEDSKHQEETDDSTDTHYYLLNTNSVNDTDDHDFMIENHVAAAFEDGYKEKINRIKAGDYVFLYASGRGIVAYGIASGVVEKTHHYGVEGKTFFQKLDPFIDISQNPIKAKQIKSILGRSFPFAQTLSNISDGSKLIDYLTAKS